MYSAIFSSKFFSFSYVCNLWIKLDKNDFSFFLWRANCFSTDYWIAHFFSVELVMRLLSNARLPNVGSVSELIVCLTGLFICPSPVLLSLSSQLYNKLASTTNLCISSSVFCKITFAILGIFYSILIILVSI